MSKGIRNYTPKEGEPAVGTGVRPRRKRPSEKWPNGPRFTVGTVTGYNATQGSSGGGGRRTKPRTIWTVHDAAHCYRVVKDFHWDGHAARSLARRLNREERAWLQSQT